MFYTGASKAYYYISYTTVGDTGDYHCQVKNLYGMADSYPARVSIKSGITTTGLTTANFLISRQPPDDIKYPPTNLGLLSSNTSSLTEGSQSTPTSLNKTHKGGPEKCLFDLPEKHVTSLPTKDLVTTGMYMYNVAELTISI